MIPVIIAGVAVRFLLYTAAPSLSVALDGHVECTTPVSSYKRLQEGLFLYLHGINPYDGGVFHQSPLLLALFSFVQNPLARNIIFSLLDGLTAYCLSLVAKKRSDSFSPKLVAATYLFNPFTLASSLAKSSMVVANAGTAAALVAAVYRRIGQSALLIALASCLSLYCSIFIPALIFIQCESEERIVKKESILKRPETSANEKHSEPVETSQKQGPNSSANKSTLAVKFLLLFSFNLALLTCLGYLTTGSVEFIKAVYGTEFMFLDITPNLGVWWYYFTEMFDAFREFFVGIFQLFVFILALPVSYRFRRYPVFAFATLQGILAAFKPYPEAGDLGLYITLLTLYAPQWPVLRYKAVIALSFTYVTVLAPTFYHLWLSLGSGNSNFFYAITLVYALGLILSLSDTMWAVLRIEFDGAKEPASQI